MAGPPLPLMSADEMFVSRSGKHEPIVTATYNNLEVKQQWQAQFQSTQILKES